MNNQQRLDIQMWMLDHYHLVCKDIREIKDTAIKAVERGNPYTVETDIAIGSVFHQTTDEDIWKVVNLAKQAFQFDDSKDDDLFNLIRKLIWNQAESTVKQWRLSFYAP